MPWVSYSVSDSCVVSLMVTDGGLIIDNKYLWSHEQDFLSRAN